MLTKIEGYDTFISFCRSQNNLFNNREGVFVWIKQY